MQGAGCVCGEKASAAPAVDAADAVFDWILSSTKQLSKRQRGRAIVLKCGQNLNVDLVKCLKMHLWLRQV